jgi:hypothetical protein
VRRIARDVEDPDHARVEPTGPEMAPVLGESGVVRLVPTRRPTPTTRSCRTPACSDARDRDEALEPSPTPSMPTVHT